jgi:hypothetical protein
VTNELGEELVGSYLYQVHLYHELESNTCGRSCQPTMPIKRSSGGIIAWIGQTSDRYGIFAQHRGLLKYYEREAALKPTGPPTMGSQSAHIKDAGELLWQKTSRA